MYLLITLLCLSRMQWSYNCTHTVHTATDMSVHVRKYARYMSSYAAGYKIMALDVCRVSKG